MFVSNIELRVFDGVQVGLLLRDLCAFLGRGLIFVEYDKKKKKKLKQVHYKVACYHFEWRFMFSEALSNCLASALVSKRAADD